MNSRVPFLVVLLLSCATIIPLPATVTIDKEHQSVLVVTAGNAVTLQPWASGTVRVEAAPGATIPDKKSLAVVSQPDATGWTATESDDAVVLKGSRMSASVDKATGLVTFTDATGKILLKQAAWGFKPAKDAARNGLDVSATFVRADGEHFYGGGVIRDLRAPSSDIRMVNGNTQIRIPVIYSSLGYGMFWDNPSDGTLGTKPDTLYWQSSAGDLVDFYVFAGPTADDAVAEYQDLTGHAPMFPKWAYGFWWCKNKFTRQDEILDAAKSFREHQIPLDLLVQDYFYWKPDDAKNNWDGWGSHHFVPERYPDPKGMIDMLHNQYHVHFMSVIWAKFDPETDHGKEMIAANALYPESGDGFGAPLRYYDPFDPKARELYGRQVMDSLLTIGVDSFWMDGAEPEMDHGKFNSFDSNGTPTSRVANAFPLMHTTSVYTAQRAATKDKRVVLLPRSSWAGEQRNGASNWTGDIRQNWDTLAWQIEGLNNYSIAGLPYVTTDVGGYWPDDVSESDKELFLRWFQWGTFCSIYRVHGVARPFPWQYGPEAEEIIKHFDQLRYRLLPYIYANAGRITQKGGAMMRPLVMDFQDDPKALDQWDEFMFGPSLLVCPVHENHEPVVSKFEQWADAGGQSGGVSATLVITGTETPVRAELKDIFGGVHFKDDLAKGVQGVKSVRVEGTYTPEADGKLELELANTNAPLSVTIDGQPATPDVPAGVWTFPQYPLEAKAGTPIHFSFETKDKRPGFRVRAATSGPQHRAVYLPGQGDWYDFWTGEKLAGPHELNPETPLSSIPLYVRAGAIIPMGPELQYANEKPADPIELRVYRGADGAFTLYEDEGDNYNYETGAFSEIPITWSENTKTLTIGERKGAFSGMLAKRTFHIVWVGKGHGGGEEAADKADATIAYEGRAVTATAPAN